MTKKVKAPLVRCSGTMTEAQYLAWIRSALRSKWLRWPPRQQTINAARRPFRGGGAQKFEVECAICHKWWKQKEIEVDHYPHDAGSILNVDDIGPFVNRLYCETTNLRAVCKPCHKVYTLSQSAGISMDEATLQKCVTEKMKSKTLLDYLASYGYSGGVVSNATKRKALVTAILRDEIEKEK